MSSIRLLFLLFGIFVIVGQSVPIALHPKNPHYFLYQGKPAILIGSTEHYGAVLNLDFDYATYLKSVKNSGMVMTRTWSGVYRELNFTFGILNNTMGPLPGRFISPWARSNQCCYKDGGNKFDLTKWDDNYFARLKDFVGLAQQYGIVVNFGIFCRFYTNDLWNLSPMNEINNINGVGANLTPSQVYNLNNDKSLIDVMTQVTVKLVTELNSFDNLFFEVINEPDDYVTTEWMDYIVNLINKTEATLPQKHLISSNTIRVTNPLVSIYSFHYGTPANVAQVYNLNKAISDGETGFAGPYDVAYRTQGWQWIISGGATYDNLDYSWTVAHPDGSAVPVVGPSGGGPELRKQLSILLQFILSFDIVNLVPDKSIIQEVTPNTAWVGVLAHKDNTEFAIYVNQTTSVSLKIKVPSDFNYKATWINPITGKIDKLVTFAGGIITLTSPTFVADVALKIERV
eukprot:TRINITY_DN790_c0_g1_i1.p1 TRINITY_DN790_c0_g1~~TRINITY_DN790_c0_g1_i1.p1  ORF type:complete len:457 (-),score=68.61 TRINITY_DN790_c0_g1_i1:40-1410(-)